MNQANPMPTEAEMNAVKDMFSRMANFIVEASQLTREVSNLRFEVDVIRRDLETAHNRNRALDDALMQAQKERDEARAELAVVREASALVERELTRLTDERKGDVDVINSLRAANDSLRRERDEASFKNLELSDELEKVKGQLKAVQDLVCPPKIVSAGHTDWDNGGMGGQR